MSTIDIGGRRFPSCSLVCPPVEGDGLSEWDRSLGVPSTLGRWHERYIPAENGLLFQVEQFGDGWNLNLYAPTCKIHDQDDGSSLWLPWPVSLVDGKLVAVGTRLMPGAWDWRQADGAWLGEFIDRLSTKPFEIPDGPRVRMVDDETKLDGARECIRSAG